MRALWQIVAVESSDPRVTLELVRRVLPGGTRSLLGHVQFDPARGPSPPILRPPTCPSDL
jgi:hypothetical protein